MNIDATLSNCYNNVMGLTRKSSKIALTSMVIAGMMMSSCSSEIGSGSNSGGGIGKKIKDGIHAIEHGAHEAWDYVTGKPPKWQREQASKNAEHVANLQQTLSKVNIKGLPKILLQCYKDASALSGVPLSVMFAITMNETGFNKHDVFINNINASINWDCGIMQANTPTTTCPVANRLAHNMTVYWLHQYDSYHAGLLDEIKALGLKYVGGGGGGRDCPHLTHAETIEYCRELDESPERIGMAGQPYIYKYYGPPLTPDPVCLAVFMGAYVLSRKMWHLKYDSGHYKYVLDKMKEYGGAAYQSALNNAGRNFIWVMAAYAYNGVSACRGFGCYFYKFSRHIHEIETGTINIIKTYF